MTAEDAGRLRADATELKASAEAWISCQPPDDYDRDHMAFWQLQARVARALLGLLPAADAGEAVTGSGLVRLGFVGGPVTYRHGVGNVSVMVWSADPSHRPEWRMNAFHAAWSNYVVVKTFDDVRRLCAALGIPLAPAAGGGA